MSAASVRVAEFFEGIARGNQEMIYTEVPEETLAEDMAESPVTEDLHVVYSLSDPISGIVRCVGMTNNILRRTCEHLSLKGDNLKLNAWIANLGVSGKLPVIDTIETCHNRADAIKRERFHVNKHRDTVYNRA